MSAGVMLRMLLRQSRGSRGRMVFFAACIAIGVAALVGVGALVAAIEAGLRAHSRELLGGDLQVESRRPLPDVNAYLPAAYRDRMAQVQLAILPTMVQNAAGASRLAELKAIDQTHGRYPLVGALGLRPDRPLSQLLDDSSVIVTAELEHELGLSIGDPLRIGGHAFVVRAVVAEQPRRIQMSFAFGPELLLTRAGLDRAGLLGFGDRVRYRALFTLPEAESGASLAALKQHLQSALPGAGTFVQIETHDEAQPALRKSMDLVARYLGLVALLSLLLGCIGVAQIVSSWMAQTAPQTAVLRCLGLRPRDVLVFHLGHVLLVSLAGSVAGGLFGMLMPVLVSHALPDWIPTASDAGLAWSALLRGIGLGVFVSVLFCVPPLTAVWKISPLQVLRSDAAELPVPRVVRWSALAASASAVLLSAWLQARNAWQAMWFTLCVFALAALLWSGARALQYLVARLPRGYLPALMWQGAAALVRPGAGTIGSIVALGLGTLVIVSISLVERIVAGEISTALPRDAPSVFLTDVQPDQWPGIERLAHGLGARNVQSVPVVTARISRIDGRDVSALVREREQAGEERDRSKWVFTREQRVTWQRDLPEHNRLVEGALWHRPELAELSIEQGYAKELGVHLGSRLTFDVQGVPIELTVTSVRNVEWRSFSPNFFLLAEPGVLDDAPQFRIAAMRVDAATEQTLQNALTAQYPNVTVVRVRSIIERVSSILKQAAFGVRLLGGFAVLTGLLILVGAVAASQLKRAREAALLKTLGVTRLRVAAMFAIEYALRGAVAGALGACGAYALAYGFTSQVLSLTRAPSIALCALAVLATALLSVVGGLFASIRALLVRPWVVLRQDGT